MQPHTTLFQRQKNIYFPENSLENRLASNTDLNNTNTPESVEISDEKKEEIINDWKAKNPENSSQNKNPETREQRYEKERQEEKNKSPIFSIIPEMRRQLAERFIGTPDIDKNGKENFNYIGTAGKLALNGVFYPFALWNIARTIQKSVVNNLAEDVFNRRIFPAVGHTANGIGQEWEAGKNIVGHGIHGGKELISGGFSGINGVRKKTQGLLMNVASLPFKPLAYVGIPLAGGIDEKFSKWAENNHKGAADSWSNIKEKTGNIGYDLGGIAGNVKQGVLTGVNTGVRDMTALVGPNAEKYIGNPITNGINEVRKNSPIKNIFAPKDEFRKKYGDPANNPTFQKGHSGWQPKSA